MDTSEVSCPLCHTQVDVPVEEMVRQRYRMSGEGRVITLLTTPPTLHAHLEHCPSKDTHSAE